MKTAEFINLFKAHMLGKKRTFGAYRVLEGDHCQVLVRSGTNRGRPGGSKLIAITFSPKITLFHGENLKYIKDSVVDEIASPKLRVNSMLLDEDADNLLDSGIIDVDEVNTKMLIEIGDTPWLLEKEESLEDEYWNWTYNVGSKVGVRCETVAEAVLDLKPQPDTITGLGWTMLRMPTGWEPDALSAGDRMTLATPPNPIDYGFKVEDCRRDTSYGSLTPDKMVLKNKHKGTPNGKKLRDAIDEWNAALCRYNDSEPGRYDNISARELGDGHIRLVGGINGIVYINGTFNQLYDHSAKMVLTGWHKLVCKSNKVRLRR